MIKSNLFKKVVSAILVLSTVCTFSMVSCFAMDASNRQRKTITFNEWCNMTTFPPNEPVDIIIDTTPINEKAIKHNPIGSDISWDEIDKIFYLCWAHLSGK